MGIDNKTDVNDLFWSSAKILMSGIFPLDLMEVGVDESETEHTND